VSDQIEYAEYLIQQDRRARGKISNPAGFFIWAIENNLSVPAEFETSRKRRLREAQQQADGEQRTRALQLEIEYDEFCQEQIRKEIESQYPADRLESALRDQLKTIKREQPEWFGRIPEITRREVALGRLKSAILDDLSLPSFERWAKLNLQPRLF
jgi:ATP-dependent Lon protease